MLSPSELGALILDFPNDAWEEVLTSGDSDEEIAARIEIGNRQIAEVLWPPPTGPVRPPTIHYAGNPIPPVSGDNLDGERYALSREARVVLGRAPQRNEWHLVAKLRTVCKTWYNRYARRNLVNRIRSWVATQQRHVRAQEIASFGRIKWALSSSHAFGNDPNLIPRLLALRDSWVCTTEHPDRGRSVSGYAFGQIPDAFIDCPTPQHRPKPLLPLYDPSLPDVVNRGAAERAFTVRTRRFLGADYLLVDAFNITLVSATEINPHSAPHGAEVKTHELRLEFRPPQDRWWYMRGDGVHSLDSARAWIPSLAPAVHHDAARKAMTLCGEGSNAGRFMRNFACMGNESINGSCVVWNYEKMQADISLLSSLVVDRRACRLERIKIHCGRGPLSGHATVGTGTQVREMLWLPTKIHTELVVGVPGGTLVLQGSTGVDARQFFAMTGRLATVAGPDRASAFQEWILKHQTKESMPDHIPFGMIGVAWHEAEFFATPAAPMLGEARFGPEDDPEPMTEA